MKQLLSVFGFAGILAILSVLVLNTGLIFLANMSFTFSQFMVTVGLVSFPIFLVFFLLGVE